MICDLIYCQRNQWRNTVKISEEWNVFISVTKSHAVLIFKIIGHNELKVMRESILWTQQITKQDVALFIDFLSVQFEGDRTDSSGQSIWFTQINFNGPIHDRLGGLFIIILDLESLSIWRRERKHDERGHLKTIQYPNAPDNNANVLQIQSFSERQSVQKHTVHWSPNCTVIPSTLLLTGVREVVNDTVYIWTIWMSWNIWWIVVTVLFVREHKMNVVRR